MIKEELEREAEKSLDKRLGTYGYIRKQDCYRTYVDGYLDSAEPREKRIAELEAQIEKMKCGQNCKHSYLYQEDRKCKFTYCDCINCKDKWELRR